MSKENNQYISLFSRPDWDVYDNSYTPHDAHTTIINQASKTQKLKKPILSKITEDIFLLSSNSSLKQNNESFEKLSTKIQYLILPKQHRQTHFFKISMQYLRNLINCHSDLGAIDHKFWQDLDKNLSLRFFYKGDNLIKKLKIALERNNLKIRERLTNNTLVITDSNFNYPLPISLIPALSLWNNQCLEKSINDIFNKLKLRFASLEQLFKTLKKHFSNIKFTLKGGKLLKTENNITRAIDYVTLIDDIFYCDYQKSISEFLKGFELFHLDGTYGFPSICIRSPVHEKVHPKVLRKKDDDFAYTAIMEKPGLQSLVELRYKKNRKSLDIWLKRCKRHLFRHKYSARVVTSKSPPLTMALVGEQVASIAAFPELVKGLLKKVGASHLHTVRLIAHNEDLIVIASPDASWNEINTVSELGLQLFRHVATDGADEVSLFRLMDLPKVALGNFKLAMVPHEFFKLIDTANNMKKIMPPGHDYYLRGLAYECLNEWGLSVNQYRHALRLDSNDSDIINALGNALVKIGEYYEALPLLDKAYEKNPHNAEIANSLGNSRLKCGFIEDAINAFEIAVKINPASADYQTNLGISYMLAKKPDKAILSLNKAIKFSPHFIKAHLSLVQFHITSGNEDLAQKHALYAYRENPANNNVANLLWHLTVGKKTVPRE